MKINDILTEQDTTAPADAAGAPGQVNKGAGSGIRSVTGAISQGAATGVGQSAAVISPGTTAITLDFGGKGVFNYEKTGRGWLESGTKQRLHPHYQQLMDYLANKKHDNLKKHGTRWEDVDLEKPIDPRLSRWLDKMADPQSLRRDQLLKQLNTLTVQELEYLGRVLQAGDQENAPANLAESVDQEKLKQLAMQIQKFGMSSQVQSMISQKMSAQDRAEPTMGDLPVQTDAGPMQINDIKSAMGAMSADDVKRIQDAIAKKLQGTD